MYDDAAVAILRQARGNVECLVLVDVGSRGNGHMMFLDPNNLEIAEQIQQ